MATEWAVAFIASPANATRVPLDCSVTEHLLCVVDAVLGTSPLLSPVPEVSPLSFQPAQSTDGILFLQFVSSSQFKNVT